MTTFKDLVDKVNEINRLIMTDDFSLDNVTHMIALGCDLELYLTNPEYIADFKEYYKKIEKL